jgi:hypothetical protein
MLCDGWNIWTNAKSILNLSKWTLLIIVNFTYTYIRKINASMNWYANEGYSAQTRVALRDNNTLFIFWTLSFFIQHAEEFTYFLDGCCGSKRVNKWTSSFQQWCIKGLQLLHIKCSSKSKGFLYHTYCVSRLVFCTWNSIYVHLG